MVNNLVFRWPTPLFSMVLGGSNSVLSFRRSFSREPRLWEKEYLIGEYDFIELE